jgi:hypothetical protein
MGLELFLRFPSKKPSLMRQRVRERQREREGQLERSTIAKTWLGGVSPGRQIPLECQMITVTS